MSARSLAITEGMRSSNVRVAVRAYVAAGWPILLVHSLSPGGKCTCRDSHCPHPGKHPIAEFFPRGVKNATSDWTRLNKALAKFPDAKIATALNELTVADVDGPAGAAKLATIELPETAVSITRRGRHYFFSGELDRTSKAEQLDLLTGKNRYAILPPSLRSDGRRYRWKFGSDSVERLPTSLVELSQGGEQRRVTVAGRPRIAEGHRNDTLFRIATGLRYRGLSDSVIREMVGIANARACDRPLGSVELDQLFASSSRYQQDASGLFGAPSITKPLPMEYLWYPYLPLHTVTLLAGDPGTGKSFLAALIAAQVSRGRRLPMSQERASGERVLILSAEDSWARTTLPRFLKAGGDIANVHIMNKFRVLNEVVLAELEKELESWRPVLIVIDTISAYMGGARDMHRQNEVGEFLGQLTELAEKANASILILAHLNKQSNEHPLYRIVGSIGFSATVRSVLFFGADKENRNRVLLAHGKVNNGEKGPTIVFERSGGGRHEVPKLRAIELSDADEWDVCAPTRNPVGRPNKEQQRAESFILQRLDLSGKRWKDLESEATKDGISAGTLNLVRARLAKDGSILQDGKGPSARWRISPKLVDGSD